MVGGESQPHYFVGIKKIDLCYLTGFVIPKLILPRPKFNYMFLHL